MSERMRTATRVAMLLLLVTAGLALADGSFDLPWWTVDGGGAMQMSGGGFTLSGTVGQPDASAQPMIGGGYMLTGGFWSATIPPCTTFAPADFDQDCDVDTNDLAVFCRCAGGPSLPVDPACDLPPNPNGQVGADFDRDADVDQSDFGIFQCCYSGPGRPADPDCAN